jgi:hypothetical protein
MYSKKKLRFRSIFVLIDYIGDTFFDLASNFLHVAKCMIRQSSSRALKPAQNIMIELVQIQAIRFRIKPSSFAIGD